MTSFFVDALYTQEESDKVVKVIEEVLDNVPIEHAVSFKCEISRDLERYGTVGQDWMYEDETPTLIRTFAVKFIWPQEPVIEKGDLFVCDNESSLTVVSISKFEQPRANNESSLLAFVNLSERRELSGGYLSNRGRLTLRLRMDPTTKQVFVNHDKKSYLHMKMNHPDYEARKPIDDVLAKPDVDARKYVNIGDVFEETRYTWDGRGYKVASEPVTKVTKCFVTIDGKRHKLLMTVNDRNHFNTPWISLNGHGYWALRQ